MTSTTKAGGRRRPYARRMPAAERREQLLDAALRLINRDGYHAVTMEAVAKEAGVTKPVVYGVYENVGSLLMQLHERQQVRGYTRLVDALPTEPGLDVDEYVSRTIKAWVETVLDDPDTWRPVFLARGGTPDVVWESIEQGKEKLRAQLAGLLRAIGVTGERDVDPDLFAHTMVAMGYHFGQKLLTDPDAVDVDKLVTMTQTLVTAAVRG